MLFDVQAAMDRINAESLVRELEAQGADLSGVIILAAVRAQRRKEARQQPASGPQGGAA